MKSGFVAVAGRPNVGKSTLVNALCGVKVAIVPDTPHTPRRRLFWNATRQAPHLTPPAPRTRPTAAQTRHRQAGPSHAGAGTRHSTGPGGMGGTVSGLGRWPSGAGMFTAEGNRIEAPGSSDPLRLLPPCGDRVRQLLALLS